MFERINRLAMRLLKAPVSQVSIIDSGAEWFKSRCGLHPQPPRDAALCRHVLLAQEPLVIPDVTEDLRFAGNSSAREELPIHAYAGVPLHSIEGVRVATLSVIDYLPRQFSADDIAILLDLAKTAEELIQLREFAFASSSCMQAAKSSEGNQQNNLETEQSGASSRTAQVPATFASTLLVESQLRRAIELEQFVLHFQPKVDLKTGHITGLEALVRWEHPEQGVVSPADFIPLAEETGLIVPLGEWVLLEACRQTKRWQEQGLQTVPVAVNISSKQFLSDAIVTTIDQTLRGTGIEAGWLEVELTESASMRDPEISARQMRALREIGVSIAIDDFGTGYSSLSYLKKLPIDKVKIDRSFVNDITQSDESLTIVQAVIAMAHRMGLKVVAEGVETEKQLAFLSINRCDEMQGYYFSKPLPAEACAALLKSDKKLVVHRPTQAVIASLFGSQ